MRDPDKDYWMNDDGHILYEQRKIEWESIDKNVRYNQGGNEHVYRTRVPGGWIVKFVCLEDLYRNPHDREPETKYINIIYVPDPEGRWTI